MNTDWLYGVIKAGEVKSLSKVQQMVDRCNRWSGGAAKPLSKCIRCQAVPGAKEKAAECSLVPGRAGQQVIAADGYYISEYIEETSIINLCTAGLKGTLLIVI